MTSKIVKEPIILPAAAVENDHDDIDIPKGKLTVISGATGSGKSYYVEHPIVNWALREKLPTILSNFKMFKILSPLGNIHPWRLEDKTFDAFIHEFEVKLSAIKGEKLLIIDEPSAFYELDSWKEFFKHVTKDENVTVVIVTQYPELLPEPELEIVMNGISITD